MEYLIVLFIFLAGLFLFGGKAKSKNSDFYYYFECIVLILLLGLRFRVGGDSIRYESYFEDYPSLSELKYFDFSLTNFQPLWFYYNAIIKEIKDSFVLFQLFHSIFVNVSFFYIINKTCVNRFFAVLLYAVLWSTYFNCEILREAYAVVFFVFSYYNFFKHKYLNSIICLCIACFWHVSAILLIIIPFLVFLLSKIKNKLWLFIFLISSILFIPIILNYVFKESAFGLLTDANMLRLEGVLQSKGLNIFGVLEKLIMMTPAFVLLYYGETKQYNNFFRVTVLLYIMIELISISFLPLIRMRNYFIIFFIIIFVNEYVVAIRSRYRLFFKIGLFILLFSRFSYFTEDYKEHAGGVEARCYHLYLPYHSVFDPVFEPLRERIAVFQFDNEI